MATGKPAYLAKYQQVEPSKDKLDLIREKARELRELEHELADRQQEVDALSQKALEIKQKDLPDLMVEANLGKLPLEAEGNYPAYEIECKPYYYASIKNEDPSAPEAYKWLEKNGHGDMVKIQYTITFGRGEQKAAKAFEKELKRLKVSFESKFGVHQQTLTAFVREQIEKFKNVPPMHLFNGKIGTHARLKEVKEKTAPAPKKQTQKY